MKLFNDTDVILYYQIAYNSLCNVFVTLHGVYTDRQFKIYNLISNCRIFDIYTFYLYYILLRVLFFFALKFYIYYVFMLHCDIPHTIKLAHSNVFYKKTLVSKLNYIFSNQNNKKKF